MPDALSRLASLNTDESLPHHYSELDALSTDILFSVSLVEMSTSFHEKSLLGYQQDGYWKRISAQLDSNDSLSEDATSLPFMKGKRLPATDSDPYFSPRPEQNSTQNQQQDQQNLTHEKLQDLIFSC